MLVPGMKELGQKRHFFFFEESNPKSLQNSYSKLPQGFVSRKPCILMIEGTQDRIKQGGMRDVLKVQDY
jgi:hypothetical protein